MAIYINFRTISSGFMFKSLQKLSYSSFASFYSNMNLKAQHSFEFSQLVNTYVDRKIKPVFQLQKMTFGQQPTEHMVSIISKNGRWEPPEIKPFQNLLMHPFNSSLHYAVQCYEGLKAYKNGKGQVRLFRPECNMYRFKISSQKIALPDFDGEQLLKILEVYVQAESEWIPPHSGYSLYIRPFHFSLQNSLGVKSPSSSQLLIVSSPVGPYYPTGFNPVKITVTSKYSRSAPGGTGSYKVGGNYGPTIQVAQQAAKRGYTQVLYLHEGKIGEVGTSNIFFVFKDPKTGKKEIITPKIQDLVLPGVTRDTIIELLRYNGQKVEVRDIFIDEVVSRHRKGELLECFCSGTAVIVSPVEQIEYNGQKMPIEINKEYKSGQLTNSIFKEILDIQQGRKQDVFGWTRIIKKM